MTDVVLTRDNEREIVFANRPASALVVGIAFAVAAYAVYLMVPDRRRWFLLAVAVVAVVISIAAMLRRQRLVLDVANNRYLREAGYWPRPASSAGPLADIEHVTLTLRLRSRGLLPRSTVRQQPLWVVSLKFREDEEPFAVLEERSEHKAYARLESLAQRLRVPAVDRTDGTERVTPWEQLGKPLAQQLQPDNNGPVALPPPPPASGIQLHGAPGRRRIVLPAHGFAYWVPVLYALPLALVAIGAAMMWQSLAQSYPAGIVVSALLLAAGLVVAFLFSAAVFGTEWIAEQREQLVIGSDLAGVTWRWQRTAKRDVRAVEIRQGLRVAVRQAPGAAGPQPVHQEVVLRSTTLQRRFGAHLTSEEREWLRDALRAIVQ